MDPKNLELTGRNVLLTPLSLAHLDELAEIGTRTELWEFTIDQILSRHDMEHYIRQALAERERGTSIPFVTRLRGTDKIVGSTRFGNIDRRNRRVEIGWTWIAPDFQRTTVNTEAKLLMLTQAFEEWECIRVEFKTDALNARSRNAILRLGAKEEGILRQHMITDRGRFRDSVYFSILDSEWTSVKANLQKKLASRS